MPGQAIVTINEEEWSVNVANTTAELIQGLSGVASLAAGTGMLFILPVAQVITVDTSQMLFPIDIIFISNGSVIDIARNISPEYLVEEATPIDMFLEVNTGEAALVEVGDAVVITDYSIITPAFDLGSIVTSIMPLIVLGFVAPMLGGMLSGGSSHSSNPSRQLGIPKTDVERKETHYAKYGTKELPERGKGRERVTVRCSICGEEVKVPLGITRSEALRKHLEEKHGPHSSNPGEYYWEITDIETGEIIQRSKPYTTISKVYRSARDYQRRRAGKDKEHLVVIRIYDTLNMEEWGKTIKPVMESGMHRGIPILIGKRPLQEEALDRLWPYSILEVHDDGDLTISSAGKKYVVTTEGGVFGEEDIIPSGGHMIEVPIGKGSQERIPIGTKVDISSGINWNWYAVQVGELEAIFRLHKWEEQEEEFNKMLSESKIKPSYEKVGKEEGREVIASYYGPKVGGYDNPKVIANFSWLNDMFFRTAGSFERDRAREHPGLGHLEYHGVVIYRKPLSEQHSISGEPRRRLVEEHGSWAVGRAEAICPEGDIACVTREAERLIETLRARYGEAVMGYVIVIEPGDTVFHSDDIISMVAMETENKRVREFGGREATYKT